MTYPHGGLGLLPLSDGLATIFFSPAAFNDGDTFSTEMARRASLGAVLHVLAIGFPSRV